MTAKIYWIHAITPLHVGAGRGVGFIDLPIVREKLTGWPLVPGSAVKGVIADTWDASEEKRKDCHQLKAAFGLAGEDSSNSGALVFSDARIACFPVRSLYGTFAYVTSPMVLKRLQRDLAEIGIQELSSITDSVQKNQITVTEDSSLRDKDKVYLEELDFEVVQNDETRGWAEKLAPMIFEDDKWKDIFIKRFAIVGDDVFNFLVEHATEVNARVKIDEDKKTVASGALWYEENLPAETILSGVVWCDRVYSDKTSAEEVWKLLDRLPMSLQIGGHATTGKGRVRLKLAEGRKPHA